MGSYREDFESKKLDIKSNSSTSATSYDDIAYSTSLVSQRPYLRMVKTKPNMLEQYHVKAGGLLSY